MNTQTQRTWDKEILKLLDQGEKEKTRFCVELEFTRCVKTPETEPEAYRLSRRKAYWPYGETNNAPPSRKVIEDITKKASALIDKVSGCYIIRWNGCIGNIATLKDSDQLFSEDFGT